MPRRLALVVAVVALCHLAVAPLELEGQGRRLRRIEVPEGETADLPGELLPPLPTREACIETVEAVADAYGSPELRDLLAEDFPNRSEFLDAISRAKQRVSGLELRIESIESTRILPWRVVATAEADGATVYGLQADCVADVRFRAVFDGSTSGQRAVTEPQRDEWRIVFTQIVSRRGAGS